LKGEVIVGFIDHSKLLASGRCITLSSKRDEKDSIVEWQVGGDTGGGPFQ